MRYDLAETHWHLHRCAGTVQIRHHVCSACQLGHITAGGGGQIVGRAFGEAESQILLGARRFTAFGCIGQGIADRKDVYLFL